MPDMSSMTNFQLYNKTQETMRINVYFVSKNSGLVHEPVVTAQIKADNRAEAVNKFTKMFLTPSREVSVDKEAGITKIYTKNDKGPVLCGGQWFICV